MSSGIRCGFPPPSNVMALANSCLAFLAIIVFNNVLLLIFQIVFT
jgi:hypothetical protein